MIKKYNLFKESKGYYRGEVLKYIQKRDISSILGLLDNTDKLQVECINLILVDIYKFIRRAKYNSNGSSNIKIVERLLQILLERGGDVDLYDEEGYSVLMNSLYISDLSVKEVLKRGPDLSYKNIERENGVNIFEYVESLQGSENGSMLYNRLYNGLKEVFPVIYREKIRDQKRKTFNL